MNFLLVPFVSEPLTACGRPVRTLARSSFRGCSFLVQPRFPITRYVSATTTWPWPLAPASLLETRSVRRLRCPRHRSTQSPDSKSMRLTSVSPWGATHTAPAPAVMCCGTPSTSIRGPTRSPVDA
jgi:hypothetical protein